MLTNLRLAGRSLLRDTGTSVVAILSLAIGLAANTTVFSLVQAVEFPRLIYPDASRLVFLETDHPGRGLEGMLVSAPDALDVVSHVRAFSSAAIAGDGSSILDTGSSLQRVGGRRVAGPFFDTFGIQAAHGRTLRADDPPGTLVLSDTLWRSAFGADPAVIGRSVRFDGGQVPIVGVMPPDFDKDADYWTPLIQAPSTFPRDDRQFSVFARLRAGTSLTQAAGELTALSSTLATQFPSANEGWTMRVFAMSRLHGRDTRGTFFLLQGAVLVMLLIACANIANLLLARGTRRAHEMALRLALGASRGRLIRLLLAEGVLLSAIGGALGVLLSLWGLRAVLNLGGFLNVVEPAINEWVLAFSLLLTVSTGLLCSVVPAWRASTVAPESALRREGARGVTSSVGWSRDALVAFQIVGALVLISAGSLLLQSWSHRQSVDLGFDPGNTLRADVSQLSGDTTDRLVERLTGHPDVAAAAALTWTLPSGAGAQRAIHRMDDTTQALDASVRRGFDAVTPAYFDTLRIPLRAGRAFTSADRTGAPPVAIVNEELARRLFGDANPIGARLRLGDDATVDPVVEIVGVSGNVRRSRMHDMPIARVYLPFAQFGGEYGVQILARGRAPLRATTLTEVAHDVDRTLLIENAGSLEADLGRFTEPLLVMTTLLTIFGLTGLGLAALGVFGTTSYVTSLRMRELAVRSALGATRADLLGIVFRTAMRPASIGVLLGAAAAVFTSRAVQSMLYGVHAGDVATLSGTAALLIVVALAACARPAFTAANTDPMTVLRRP